MLLLLLHVHENLQQDTHQSTRARKEKKRNISQQDEISERAAEKKRKSTSRTVREGIVHLEMKSYTIAATVVGGALGFVAGVCSCC